MRSLLVVALAALAAAGAPPARVETALFEAPRSSYAARPELLPYDALANPAAVVTDSSGTARFTVLTPRIIRMESVAGGTRGSFEDRATIAILNRNLPVPEFVHAEVGGVLYVNTSEVSLRYTVGAAFAADTLSVTSTSASATAFTSWYYGQPAPGNLLGTIRGLDQQGPTPLNCTVNAGIDDNGEFNHCEFGLVSRDGWVIYNDTLNYALTSEDWWSMDGDRQCLAPQPGTDAVNPTRSVMYPNGLSVADEGACCDACMADPTCLGGYVFDTAADSPNCWPLSGFSGTSSASNRVLTPVRNPSHNTDVLDLYGFFHGHDYFGAIAEFTLISGKTIMVPRYASGVWWSRWFDIGNWDVRKIVDDYESRRIPLDVFVIDMDWHTKDNWSGFTFDQHLFPFPADTMAYLRARGLGITLNIHDASGVNNWEALFPELVSALGLPSSSTVVPFNIVNATVAYAVEDIILGDLLYNKSIGFWWIDWQQGGSQGGMTGGKQNPTIWLNHIRCTDRHRNGDDTRAMVLARWGGMGGHRYQVGFSGDVAGLSWTNMQYQPYFSATSANVAHGFWSHDIEGPADDMELYTRWIQVGAFSGVMRSHDRGMSGGGCANSNPFSCSIVEVWNTPAVANMEANRAALQLREELVPYIYNGHRAAFDTGVGLIIPMYYYWPELDSAYAMDGAGNGVQYMFGPSILFSPVVTPASAAPGLNGLASKTTWLPPGTWFDANSGVLTTVPAGTDNYTVTKGYALTEIPMWYAGGAVIPYLPLRSLPVIGLASRQYSFLGFKIVPGAASGSTQVYEDDGATTAYLTGNAYAWTTAAYTTTTSSTTVTISTNGSFPELPATRAYQLRLLNGAVPASVTVNGASVPYARWGILASNGQVPSSAQWYYDFATYAGAGLGVVIDLPGLSTAATVQVVITYASPAVTPAQMSGVYGAVMHAIWAKANTDLDRSTPGSNSDDPAYMSVLSSTGDALAYLAGTNVTGFAATVAGVPQLLNNAIADLQAQDKSPRVPYSVALLQSAMV